jgi:hypothetical protein
MKTFKHSGDLGDIIYSLPTIRALGGGILYLDPNGGADEELIRRQCPEGKTKLDKGKIDFLKPILEAQPYIKEVRYWGGEPVTHNLNEFRITFGNPNKRSPTSNLSDCHLERFNLPFSETDSPWLNVTEKIKLSRPVVISRGPRVQGGYGRLNAMKMNLRNDAIFVGLPKEHEFFEWTFDIKIPYHKTETVMELAAVINGADVFIGNSSFPLSLAIGMGHNNIVQEVDPKVPTTVFQNKKMIYL